jgi:hypothetical protein
MHFKTDRTGSQYSAQDTLELETRKPLGEGLCVDCDHSAHCGLSLEKGRPVHFCEEYQSRERECESPRGLNPAAGHCQEAIQDAGPGLCGNCDHLSHCRLPKAEGGVWYCEEYE